uniref:Uncharacterized protein n=1 Tax=Meloidogyne enterolobii TaxID=390850 RepID=A0A6V7W1F7_MELEN|nr:unnamed protein product [Meloidogyne enterolobii]
MKMEGTITTTHIHTSILYLALNRMDSLPEPSLFYYFPQALILYGWRGKKASRWNWDGTIYIHYLKQKNRKSKR